MGTTERKLHFGDFVGGMNEHAVAQGVIVATKGTRALVCDNHFAAVMIRDFGVTMEYVRQEFKCRWFEMDQLELDDDDDDWDEDN